jgi:hypothetical protein
LPNGIFSDQKSQYGYVLVGLAVENVVILCVIIGKLGGHLVYVLAIWYILW